MQAADRSFTAFHEEGALIEEAGEGSEGDSQSQLGLGFSEKEKALPAISAENINVAELNLSLEKEGF